MLHSNARYISSRQLYRTACGTTVKYTGVASVSDKVDCPRCLKALQTPTSWNVEASDSSGFGANGLFFATKEEGERYASDLFSRWMSCKATRVVPSRQLVNYRWDPKGGLVSLERPQPAKEATP